MMKVLFVISILFYCSFTDFKQEQLKFTRVRTAYHEKEETARKLFAARDISLANSEIYLRAFKQEEIIELWAKDKQDTAFSLVKEYSICSSSGTPGPKRKQGDGQVPEGHYYINRFNPFSSFYLSLGINYPNESDKVRGEKSNLGGDIFIHGSCVTIGCLPVTDNEIKELYLICVEAKSGGEERIPVTIFPAKLSEGNYTDLVRQYSSSPQTIELWTELKSVFDFFDSGKKIPQIQIGKKGNYITGG